MAREVPWVRAPGPCRKIHSVHARRGAPFTQPAVDWSGREKRASVTGQRRQPGYGHPDLTSHDVPTTSAGTAAGRRQQGGEAARRCRPPAPEDAWPGRSQEDGNGRRRVPDRSLPGGRSVRRFTLDWQ